MDPMNGTVTELRDMFLKRMTDFEAELKKIPDTSSSSSNLAAEFAAFRTFITQALTSLQQQVEIIARNIDSMETRGRRGILLLHGVAEVHNEDTAQVVANIIKEHLKMGAISSADIKRCHRMGRSGASHKTRPILCKFRDLAVRNKVWFDKTKLKGSGVTVSEFLTKARHDLFMAARDKLGVPNCWTRDGTVYCLGRNGSRQRILTLSDLNRIDRKDTLTTATELVSADASPEKPLTSTRPKRAVTLKK